MKTYIGTKIIDAKAMSRHEYLEYTGQEVSGENQDGYLVEYPAEPGNPPNHNLHKGYISWSPKDVFEKYYRVASGMDFGEALRLLKAGYRVQREGWNGKGMFLFLLPAGKVPFSAIHDSRLRTVLETELIDDEGKFPGEFEALGSIRMWTADKKILTGWLASQTDMLSEDWNVLTD
jgi:hypothetical protein